MTNHQAAFIGSCILIGCGIMGASIGAIGSAIRPGDGDASAVGGIALIGGLIFAIVSYQRMKSEHKDQ